MTSANSKATTRRSKKDSFFLRITKWLHLWLGLVSGVIVFIVCITACIWVFNEEINVLLHPETKIVRQDRPVLTPSQIAAIAQKLYPKKEVHYVFCHKNRPITVNLAVEGPDGQHSGTTLVKLNPYSGDVISNVEYDNNQADFFRVILNGHRFLWLPMEIGRPIVNYGTLIFVFLLITGLIWWYPKKWNKSTFDKGFKIKWGASIKRVNVDLHNVLGFYSLVILLVLALTGMVYGITWFSNGLYWSTSGGKQLIDYDHFHSDTLQVQQDHNIMSAMDNAWDKVLQKHPRAAGFFYSFVHDEDVEDAIGITVYPDNNLLYKSINYYFDQYSLQEFSGKSLYAIPYQESDFGSKLRRMNYDIHVGSILGFPGKVLAFFASLIGASLPVTGFLIWYWRKFKKKKLRINS